MVCSFQYNTKSYNYLVEHISKYINFWCYCQWNCILMSFINFYFIKTLCFWAVLCLQQHWRKEISHILVILICVQPYNSQHPPPDWYICLRWWIILSHHRKPKPVVYIRFHFWCCIFYGVGKMYNDMSASLVAHSKEFSCNAGSIPVRKIHWRRKWQPTPVLLTGKSPRQRSLVGSSQWGHQSQSWLGN